MMDTALGNLKLDQEKQMRWLKETWHNSTDSFELTLHDMFDLVCRHGNGRPLGSTETVVAFSTKNSV